MKFRPIILSLVLVAIVGVVNMSDRRLQVAQICLLQTELKWLEHKRGFYSGAAYRDMVWMTALQEVATNRALITTTNENEFKFEVHPPKPVKKIPRDPALIL